MEGKRFLRPICVILTVLYALNGVYIVIKHALIAFIERFSEVSAAVFVNGSGIAELVLFTLCTGICLLCAAFLSSGRQRAAFFVLAVAQAVIALGNLLSSLLQPNSMYLSLCVMVGSACCTIIGYALLAYAGPAKELRAIGWLCAGLAGINQLCSALSIFSVIMLNGGTQSLWFAIFIKTARISSVLSIVANIAQALCFVLVFFAVQRTEGVAVSESDAAQGRPVQGQDLCENSSDTVSETKVPSGPDKSTEND